MKFCPKCNTEYSFLSHSVWKKTGVRICSKCDNEKLEEELNEPAGEEEAQEEKE